MTIGDYQEEGWWNDRPIRFQVAGAFYRSSMATVRELGVLAAAVYRQTQGQLRVLEPMAASGVRSLRYGLEAGADYLWVNDGNPALKPLLQGNLGRYFGREGLAHPLAYRVTSLRAEQIFALCVLKDDRYDLVDLDPFGSPQGYSVTALDALKPGGLLYVTATDGQILGGHAPEQCLERYGAYGRSFPCAQEQGLRIMVGHWLAAAQGRGWSLRPLLSTFTGQTFRVMLRLERRRQSLGSTYSFLGYCQGCGAYSRVSWRKLSRATCVHHDPPQPLTLSGPLWLGPLHDRSHVAALRALADQWGWSRAIVTLDAMAAEADLPPYHFSLGEVGRWGHQDPPPRDPFFATIRAAGYPVAALHWNPQRFKTDAPWPLCLALARAWA